MTPTGSSMSAFRADTITSICLIQFLAAMNRFLNTVQPKLVIVMGPSWLNMVLALHKRKILLVIASALIQSFR